MHHLTGRGLLSASGSPCLALTGITCTGNHRALVSSSAATGRPLLGIGMQGQPARSLKIGGAIPQTAPIPLVAMRDNYGCLTFATHSPADSQRDRRCRSALLRWTRPKRLF